MQPFAVTFRSVAPDLDVAVQKLRASSETFWVKEHADIWPAAVPQLNFDDLPDEEEDEADDEQAPAPPARKRKAALEEN